MGVKSVTFYAHVAVFSYFCLNFLNLDEDRGDGPGPERHEHRAEAAGRVEAAADVAQNHRPHLTVSAKFPCFSDAFR